MAAEGKEAYAVFDSSDGSLTFFVDDEGKYTNGEVIETKTYWTGVENTRTTRASIPWNSYRSSIKTVKIEDEITPERTMFWFYNCDNLISCDLKLLDTSNVTNMGSMFQNCYSLDSLNLTSFNTSNVRYMRSIFYSCKALTSLNLSNFDTSTVEDMTYMFKDSTSLEQILVGEQWDTSNVSSSSEMFTNCTKLPNFDANYTDKTRAYYGEKDGVKGYLALREAYAKLDLEGTLTFFIDDSGKYEENDLTEITTLAGLSYVFNETLDLSDYEGHSHFSINFTYPKDSSTIRWDGLDFNLYDNDLLSYREYPLHDDVYAYYENSWISGEEMRYITITGGEDADNADLIQWLKENGTFYSNDDFAEYWTGIETTNYSVSNRPPWVNNLRITKVIAKDPIFPISLAYWFYQCAAIKSLNLANIDAINATNMEGMFYNCARLEEYTFDVQNTNNITNMASMFNSCFSLINLDITELDTSNVVNMMNMFTNCTKLNTAFSGVSAFNTQKVHTMQRMFYNCTSLEFVDLSSFDMTYVEDIRGIFEGCSNLREIRGISNLTFGRVVNCSRAFAGLRDLELDLSGFANPLRGDCERIFENTTLTKIIFPVDFQPVGNWREAFKNATIKQNIIVKATPSVSTNIFEGLTADSEVYIIWNGDLSTSQNKWPGICRDYSNVHYELDDAAFTADLTKSTRGIYDSTNNEWTTDDGGEYIRFLLNYNVPTTNIPFGFSNTGNTIEFYRRDGNTPTHLDPEQGEIIADPDNSNTYYHEIDSTKLKDNYNYYGVATIQFTDGTLTLSKSATTLDVTILGQFAIIDVLPKGHTIALGKVAERIYEAISSPTGSPKDQGWYELVSGEYVLSTDETVSTGKTYYKEAPSLQIGLPMYYNEHDSYIGKILSGTSRASSTFTVTTSWQDINEILLTPGTWIIKGWVSFNGSTAGNRRILIRDQYHLTSLPEASSTNFAGYAPANTHTLVSGVVIVSISVNTIYYLKVRTDAGSPIGRYSQLQALRIL